MDTFEAFKQLHYQNKPFILPNAWNAKSAQVIEQSGFEAIATSSGAIANSLGYEDGEIIPLAELFYIIERIKATTTIPLTVDFERGYTADLIKLTASIQRLVEIGVVGINLEDNQGEALYLKKLHSIKKLPGENNLKLFINARTDGFLQKVEAPIETTIKRAALYQDAGADGIFVTGVSDIPTIKAISSSIALPLNVVGTPKLSSFSTLSEAGVSRISMAVFLYKTAYNPLGDILRKINELQSLEPLF